VNKVLIKQYPHVQFKMKDGKRYLQLPETPPSPKGGENEVQSLSLAIAKARMAKRNFQNSGTQSPEGSKAEP
jgi:hypothetical protein